MFIPEISASKVAAFIGLNPYQSPDETAYSLLLKDPVLKEKIQAAERTYNRKSYQSVVNKILADDTIRDCINSGLNSCKKTSDVNGVLESVEQSANIILTLRHDSLTPELRTQIATEVRGMVSKRRGLDNEDSILNTYEQEQDVKVVERNTKMLRKNYGKFKLVGRTDGFVASENRIVDSKDRTRVWKTVPIYDEVQMRCYMDMSGVTETELIERFPDKTTRHTKFKNDAEKWKVLQTAIEKKVDALLEAIADPEKLKRIVFANTVEL